MKLYKEASLMMLPTSVKDGKLYSIFPQPKPLSGELVTNGGFDEDAWWNKGAGWTISDGKANATGAAFSRLETPSGLDAILTIGKIYKCTFNVVDADGGEIYVERNINDVVLTGVDSVGNYAVYFTATDDQLRFQSRNTSSISIDNISVVEVDQLDADFDFSRGSNLAATRINEQGLIEKGRENLLLYSNQFDTNWTGEARTGGFEGYDGSNDAWKVTKIAQNYTAIQQLVTLSGVWTLSVYAKSDTLNDISFRNQSDGTRCDFDLLNGVVGFSGSNIKSKSIEDVGNGWYRCKAAFLGSSSQIAIYVGWNNATAGSVFFQDAQLEVGLVATDYIESGATTGKAGVLEDLPRLNWGNCPSLLLEPSRTNYIPYSEKLDSNSHSGGTFYPNQVISPDGTLNAYGIDQDSGGNRIQPSIGSYDGLVTMSMYIKPVATIKPRLNIYNSSNQTAYGAIFEWDGSDFTIVSYSLGYTDAGYEDVGNGWYRLYIVGTSVSGSGSTLAQFRYNTDTDISNRLYVWGLQAERGSYPTSYIPTHGTSVTRSADTIATKDITDIITGDSFTWFLDLEDWQGSDSNKNELEIVSSSDVKIQFRVRFDGYRVYYHNIQGGAQYPIAGSTTANKVCVSYDGQNYRLYIDGVKVATTSSVGDTGWNEFSNRADAGTTATIPLKQMTIFNTALSDNECINLTAI